MFTLPPVRLLGVTSDGAHLRQFARDGLDAQRTSALTAIEFADLAGQRPRAWDDSLIERASSADGNARSDWLAHVFAYRRALDLGRPHEAGTHLTLAGRYFDTLAPASRAALALEAAYFEAAFREDAAAGRRWLRWTGGWALINPPARPLECHDKTISPGVANTREVYGSDGVVSVRNVASAGLGLHVISDIVSLRHDRHAI